MTKPVLASNAPGTALPEFVVLPISDIDRSENYRKTHDPAADAELAASIKTKGVISPIIVRPSSAESKGAPVFKLVAGERRIRASILAGLRTIPAIVRRDIDDAAARELSLVENLQRKNVDPLEEAEGFRELHEKFKRAVDDIATAVGQKKSYVYARMKLCALCEEGRKLYRDGKLDVSAATVIARIPSVETQRKALEELSRWHNVDYDTVLRLVQERYMLRLTVAPFDTTDEKLLPQAGACTKCPKRTGNQRELFADVKGHDTCTDPPCFKAKSDAAWKTIAAEAEKNGEKVIEDKQAQKLFPHGGNVSPSSAYVDMDETCWDDPKHRTYRQIVSKDAEVHVARDPSGRVHRLLQRAALPKVMKDSGVKPRAYDGPADGDDPGRERAAEKAKQEKRRQLVRAAIGQIVDHAKPGDGFWRLLLVALSSQGFNDAIGEVVKRRGWSEKGKRAEVVFERHAAALKGDEVARLVLELVVSRNAYFSYATALPDNVVAGCKTFGIDLKKLRQEVEKTDKLEPAKKGGRR